MIKIRVHIHSDNTWMDTEVFADILLPAVPQIGNEISIGKEAMDQLHLKAASSLGIAERYFPDWFYGGFGADKLTKKYLKHLSFEDASYVKSVFFIANDEAVHIEISDIDPSKVVDELQEFLNENLMH